MNVFLGLFILFCFLMLMISLTHDEPYSNVIGVLAIILGGIIFAWLGLASKCEVRESDWTHKEMVVSRLNNADVFLDEETNEIVNLNSRFGQRFEEGETIEVKWFNGGWYGGIYFVKTEDFLKLVKQEEGGQ